MNEKTTYSPLRNYSEEELTAIIKADPSIMAIDAMNYKDRMYVRNVCKLYLAVARNATTLTATKHFRIENFELALTKLSKEHPHDFKNLCQFYGIDLKSKTAKTAKSIKNNSNGILYLSSWGYIELFFPNLLITIEKIAKKVHSKSKMSDLEKAKYAHIFFVFIYTFNALPYDVKRYLELKNEAEQEKNNNQLNKQEREELFRQALTEMQERDRKTAFEAVMLNNAYEVLFDMMEDEELDADMIRSFLDDVLLDQKDALLIKEFVDLLSQEEASLFKSMGLKPIKYNTDVRQIKERIFSKGEWDTNVRLFLTSNDEKFNQTVKYGWNKFEKNNYVFGANVQPVKSPAVFTHVNGSQYQYMGYLYAKDPLALRISDENELWMIRTYLMNL